MGLDILYPVPLSLFKQFLAVSLVIILDIKASLAAVLTTKSYLMKMQLYHGSGYEARARSKRRPKRLRCYQGTLSAKLIRMTSYSEQTIPFVYWFLSKYMCFCRSCFS